MTFRKAEAYLYSLGNEVEAMKLGLENIAGLLDALGAPHMKYEKVQVAGTNGKGSVCAFLNAICLRAGVRTGLYTSPHLVSITERIKINGEDISETEFARLATQVREVAEELLDNGRIEYRPTFFEQVTAIALAGFADAGVELAILETGLGGRYDAVTAANAEIAAITRIDLDHQEYLGDTLSEIAAEKAEIIRPDSITVIGEQAVEPGRILVEHCKKVGVAPTYADFVDVREEDRKLVFTTDLADYEVGGLGLAGDHQLENATIALLVAEKLRRRFTILNCEITDGLENARHPGRLERIGQFLLDGAHNPGGARALAAYLEKFVDDPITLIFGAMKDKDAREIARILWPKAEKIILTHPTNPRSATPEDLLAIAPGGIDRERIVLIGPVEDAVGEARRASSDNIILVTGSLYLVGDVRKILQAEHVI